MGEAPDSHREFHKLFLQTEGDKKEGAIFATKRLWTIPNSKEQHWNCSWESVAWHSVNLPLKEWSGNKEAFLGQYGKVAAPASMKTGKYLTELLRFLKKSDSIFFRAERQPRTEKERRNILIPVLCLPKFLESLLVPFSSVFSKPQFRQFRRYVFGLMLCLEARKIQRMRGTDQSNLNWFVTQAHGDVKKLEERIAQLGLELIDDEEPLFLSLEDTLCEKSGRKREGAGWGADRRIPRLRRIFVVGSAQCQTSQTRSQTIHWRTGGMG